MKRGAHVGRGPELCFALSLSNLALIHVWGVLLYAGGLAVAAILSLAASVTTRPPDQSSGGTN